MLRALRSLSSSNSAAEASDARMGRPSSRWRVGAAAFGTQAVRVIDLARQKASALSDCSKPSR
jgi:hypothetical protein